MFSASGVKDTKPEMSLAFQEGNGIWSTSRIRRERCM